MGIQPWKLKRDRNRRSRIWFQRMEYRNTISCEFVLGFL